MYSAHPPIPTMKAKSQRRWPKRRPSDRQGWRTDSFGSREVIECCATHDQLKAAAVTRPRISPTTSDAWDEMPN
jgi:hypothetical protein